jgi:hypothetical protein
MTKELGFWQGIMDTARGRGQLRFVLQPIISTLLGIRLGIADAKSGDEPFLRRLFLTGKARMQVAREALRDVLVPFTIAITLDAVLQYFALGYVRPVAAIVVGAALVWVPFSLARSIAHRIARGVGAHHGPTTSASAPG